MTQPPGATPPASVHLDAADEARLARLTHELAADAASRDDVVRALLVVAERNAGIRSALGAEVRTARVRRDPAAEVAAVAGALRDLAAGARDDLEARAGELDGLAEAVTDDAPAVSDPLHRVALAVEGLESDRVDVLRAAAALAERLEVVRDAVEPSAKTRCSICHRPVRALAGGRPEAHLDRTRTPCTAGPVGRR